MQPAAPEGADLLGPKCHLTAQSQGLGIDAEGHGGRGSLSRPAARQWPGNLCDRLRLYPLN